jgi:N4-gp56 family major capsid protein
MALTNFNKLTTEQLTTWSRDTWRYARNMAFVNKFVGSDENSMIQRITELKKDDKGARAVITLVADLEGDGVAGDRTLEGNEEAMKSYDQVIRVDQLRHANRHEGRMADQKSVVQFRKNSKNVLAYWLADRIDQMAFLTLAGMSYSLKPNGASRVGSDLVNLEFSADVTAPSSARATRWSAASGLITSGAATSGVTASDTIKWQTLIDLKAYAKDQYIRGIKEEGGEETFHVFLTPRGMARLKMDSDYMNNLRNAGPRDSSNPLFKGGAVKVDGLYLHEFRHVPNTLGATSGSGKWGAGNNVDGEAMLFCGAQALGMADIGDPYWVEKGFDYENQQGISLGKIFGLLKPQFTSQYAGNTKQDFGVIVNYHAL